MTIKEVLLSAPLVSSMLPSPSVLTGNFRPQTAATFLEQTLTEAKARSACGSRHGTPAPPLSLSLVPSQPQTKVKAEEVGALRSMASRHLGQLHQAPPSPYVPQHPPLPSRCLSTPPMRRQQSLLQTAPPPPPRTPSLRPQPPPLSLEPSGREVTPPPPPAGGGAAVGTAAVALTPRAGGPDSPGPAAPAAASGSGGAASGFGSTVDGLSLVVSLPTEDVHPYGSITGCSSHPLFASYRMPTSPPTLPRLVLAAPPAPPPAQWDDAPAPDATAPAEMPGGASPARTPRLSGGVSSHAFRTPPPLQPFAPPGPSGALAAPGSSPLPGSSRRFTTALSPSSRPHTSLSVQELSLPRPGKHLGSRSPTRGSWTPLMNVSWAGSANGSVIGSSVTAAGGGGDGGGGGAPAAAVAASTTAASSSPSPNGAAPRFQHTATRWASMASSPAAGTTAGGAQWGSDSSARTAGIKVTRGMLYSVFQELDEFDSGRLTYSAFEQAACRIGMRPAQAKRLFEQLDPQGRGYATMREWSSPQLQRQMDSFTRLYVQATRGADGRPKDITEVRSMHMAIQMAMLKLQLKRSGRAVSLDRLVQAFAFMDRDGNGALNAEEVEDALNSLGIFVTKEVVDAVMKSFDKDGNGCVDYFEFVKSLYPTRDSVYHH